MDEDDEYVEEEKSSAQGSATSDIDHDHYQRIARDEILQLSPSKNNGALDHHTSKWLRLKKHYSDRYLELFNTIHSGSVDDKAFEESQFGSVKWTALEKSVFFTALSRSGRHDLPGLAAAVNTKSEVEIKDYLDRLKSAEIERQMFASRAKNVSQADMAAAIEIGEECEAILENAADALAAYQECFDQVSTQYQIDDIWIIDANTAEKMDTTSEVMDADQPDEAYETQFGGRPGRGLFHLSKFLELSRKLFMNMPPDSDHGNWRQLADADESPSIAVDAVDTFHGLVVSIVRRVAQTAIFLAQSRIRATQATGQTPAQTLTDADVEAALDILKMPPHGFDFWIGWVKRSKVKVVAGAHRAGETVHNVLDFQQIEEVLSIRSTRRRSSSLSSLLSMTSTDSSTFGESGSEREPSTVDEGELQQHQSDGGESPSAESAEASTSQGTNEESSVGDFDGQDLSEDTDDASQSGNGHYVGRKRRLQMLENEQDEYLERLDQASRQREEALIHQALGQSRIKAESPESSGWHPSIQRKTNEDLHDWSDMQYRAPWEVSNERNQQTLTTSNEDNSLINP